MVDFNAIREQRDQALEKVAEYRQLFDMQWKRMAEATERWRAEDPDVRALIMPDLGALLTWLMAAADQAHAAGYAQAIARIRDDGRYLEWRDTRVNGYIQRSHRHRLAAYLEATDVPDGQVTRRD